MPLTLLQIFHIEQIGLVYIISYICHWAL